MLDVSPASANEMIGKLQDRGFADHEKYKGVSLTGDGIVRAHEWSRIACSTSSLMVTETMRSIGKRLARTTSGFWGGRDSVPTYPVRLT